MVPTVVIKFVMLDRILGNLLPKDLPNNLVRAPSTRNATKFHPTNPRKGNKSPIHSPLAKGKSKLSHTSFVEKDGGGSGISGVSTRPTGGSNSRKRSSNTKPVLNIDPKHFVIGSSPKRDIIGGSHYSRALLVNGTYG